jgi:hypothetical protein
VVIQAKDWEQKCSLSHINISNHKQSSMNNYYTYAYLREDGTPYYIGKGKGKRAYKKGKNEIKPPKDRNRIIFLKTDLTSQRALTHEIYMISIFGRIDLGTGILHNKTDGGEGVVNMSEITKKKISISRKGMVFGESHRENIGNAFRGKKLNEERKKQISLQSKKNWENPEYRKKVSLSCKRNCKPPIKVGEDHHFSSIWKITFSDGKIIEKCGISKWARDNNYDCNKIYLIAKGKRKKHKDIVAVQKLDKNP